MDFFKAIADIYAPKVEDAIESQQPDTSRTEPQGAIQSISSNSSYESQIFYSVNEYRTNLRLCGLRSVAQLNEIALTHSRAMQKVNTASHDNGTERGKQAQALGLMSFGENVQMRQCYPHQVAETINQFVPGWIGSPGHRQTMEMSIFTYTGIGLVIAPYQKGTVIIFATQVFAGA